MTTQLMLIVRALDQQYAVHRDEVFDIKIIPNATVLEDETYFDHPTHGVELGMLLGVQTRPATGRRHALLVPIRRRYVALLVDAVETFLEHMTYAPLPALLRDRLLTPWAAGALVIENELILHLDLRAIARSVLLNRSAEL